MQQPDPRIALDYAAGATGITAPAWVYLLNEVNSILAFVSLMLSIAFVAWRWWRAAKRPPE